MRYLPRIHPSREYESPIGQYRVAMGLTIAELCELAGVAQHTYSALQNGMQSPLSNQRGSIGQPRAAALAICRVLHVDFEEAFPRYFCRIIPPVDLTDEQVLDISHSQPPADLERTVFARRRIEQVLAACRSLTNRERLVLHRYHVQGDTLEEVGGRLDLSRNRIAQILWKSERKLRRTARQLRLYEQVRRLVRLWEAYA
jgi:transcriptional regulator with XRE-family HTH domain